MRHKTFNSACLADIRGRINFEKIGYKKIRCDHAFRIFEKPTSKFVFDLVNHTYRKLSEVDEPINMLETLAIENELTELRWIP